MLTPNDKEPGSEQIQSSGKHVIDETIQSTFDQSTGSTLGLLLLCALAGTLTGLVGGIFRVLLQCSNEYRLQLTQWIHTVNPWLGFAAVVGCSVVCVAVARFLIRYSPTAGGSGIQYVEAMWNDETKPAGISVLFVKFFGGLLALGSGMALGREGPTVQMGASIGAWIGRVFHLSYQDVKYITVAAAGTGLGVAFSAPLGGASFTLEEVTKDISTRLVICTILSVVFGTAVSMSILGSKPNYDVIQNVFAVPGATELVMMLIFGIFMGMLGVFYNKTVLLFLELQEYFRWLVPEVRVGIIALTLGLMLWFTPELTGGGDDLAQSVLNNVYPIEMLILIGVVRWVFAPICYSSGTPGGLFSPLLLMGALLGQVFTWLVGLAGIELNTLAFCAVGMSAFFAATIRAPLTGVLLILEMTACWTLTIPMIAASAMAFMTALAMKDLPIYTSLRLRIKALKEVS